MDYEMASENAARDGKVFPGYLAFRVKSARAASR